MKSIKKTKNSTSLLECLKWHRTGFREKCNNISWINSSGLERSANSFKLGLIYVFDNKNRKYNTDPCSVAIVYPFVPPLLCLRKITWKFRFDYSFERTLRNKTLFLSVRVYCVFVLEKVQLRLFLVSRLGLIIEQSFSLFFRVCFVFLQYFSWTMW